MKAYGRVWTGIVLGGCLLAAGGPRPAAAEVYADKLTKRFHTAECPQRQAIAPKNLLVFDAEAAAGARGFYPDPVCIPPTGHEAAASQRRLSQPVTRGQAYLGDRSVKIYHSAWCPAAKKIAPADLVRFPDVGRAAAAGYAPCDVCHPPRPLVKYEAVPKVPAQKAEPPARAPAPGKP